MSWALGFDLCTIPAGHEAGVVILALKIRSNLKFFACGAEKLQNVVIGHRHYKKMFLVVGLESKEHPSMYSRAPDILSKQLNIQASFSCTFSFTVVYYLVDFKFLCSLADDDWTWFLIRPCCIYRASV